VAVLCVVAAIVYFTKTADALPSFFPGHSAGSTKHHTKHGLGMIMLALVALFGAWMSTAPNAD
jgi:amino acid permease